MKFVKIGYVAGSFGVWGGMKVKPLTEHPEAFYDLEFLLLSSDGKKLDKSLKILSIEPHGEVFVIKCEGFDSKDKSDALRNMSVVMLEENLPEIGDDEVYWYMIEGADVEDTAGNKVGTLIDYIETGPNDVLRIKLSEGGHALISNNKTHVLSIDARERKIVIELAGLVREDI